MAFGQSSGPPATGKQLRELQELLEAAGHSDFRDARGPMGFTQRQAGGKFTRDEADEFIERLEIEVHGDGPPPGSRPPSTARSATPSPSNAAPSKIVPRQQTRQPARRVQPPKPKAPDIDLGDVPTEQLAAELQSRGWVVLEP